LIFEGVVSIVRYILSRQPCIRLFGALFDAMASHHCALVFLAFEHPFVIRKILAWVTYAIKPVLYQDQNFAERFEDSKGLPYLYS